MATINHLDNYTLARILASSEQHPSINGCVSSLFHEIMKTPEYIIERLNHIAQAEECSVANLGRKLGINNFSLLSLNKKIHAVYKKYHQVAQFIAKHYPDWSEIDKLPFNEFKRYVLAYNRLQFWKKLPGGREFLEESEEMSPLKDIQKSERFPILFRNNPGILNLTKLVLSLSDLTELPPEINLFENLDSLCLFSNHLTSLPNELNLPHLRKMSLIGNLLTEFPINLNLFPHLIWLDLSANHLTKLPSSISNCFLRVLHLAGNPLIELPDDFNPPELERLDLSSTLLRKLPYKFNPPKLRWLNLENNQTIEISSNSDLFRIAKVHIRNTIIRRSSDEISEETQNLPPSRNFIYRSLAYLGHLLLRRK